MDFRRAFATRLGFLLAATLVAVAAAALILPDTPVPRLAIFAPIAYALAIVGDAATAIIIFAMWRNSPVRHSAIALALSFAACAVLLCGALLTLPSIPGLAPILTAPAQTGIWLLVFWHAGTAAGAIAYVLLRRRDRTQTPSLRFTLTAIAIVLALLGGAMLTAWHGSRWLPPLASGPSATKLLTMVLGPAVDAALAVATLLVFTIREPLPIARALGYSLLAITLEFTLILAGGQRFSASYYLGRLLLLSGAVFVFMASVRRLVDDRIQLSGAALALVQLETVAENRADRIRALWRIATPSGPERRPTAEAILQTATAAIRPGKPMFGYLSHLDGDMMVIDETAWSGSDGRAASTAGIVYPGAAFALRRTTRSLLAPGVATCSWDDLATIDCSPGMLWEELGWQSMIGTAVTVGNETHFLNFASPERMLDQPYVEDDRAYVDVVASFFSTQFTEHLQYKQLLFQIEHDALTGLKTRAQFRNAIRGELRIQKPFAVAFVDIDGFRHLNERQGYMLGDELLVEVAASLNAVNDDDLVSRTSGDEFGILLRAATADALQARLETYARCFNVPFHTGDATGEKVLKLGASIGAAAFPADGDSAEELMRRADVALRVAKERGGSTTRSFDPSMEGMLHEFDIRRAELADAIANDQLDLLYQPTFEIATRKVVGGEALIRWNHPDHGLLAPPAFVPFAEQAGLIGPLTEWALARLARDIGSGAALPNGFRLYLNLAAQTLDDLTFIAHLNDTLRRNPGLVEHLGIEITETAAMQNVQSSMHTINLLRGWGLSVAIDDFGTGYSSLAYLKQLTVDVIKIDRSFVSGLPNDERDGIITSMLLEITQRFGFASLAEGIETEAQARWLLEHGCRFGQGFLVARPDSYATLLERAGAIRAIA